jgi:hypothetical protein
VTKKSPEGPELPPRRPVPYSPPNPQPGSGVVSLEGFGDDTLYEESEGSHLYEVPVTLTGQKVMGKAGATVEQPPLAPPRRGSSSSVGGGGGGGGSGADGGEILYTAPVGPAGTAAQKIYSTTALDDADGASAVYEALSGVSAVGSQSQELYAPMSDRGDDDDDDDGLYEATDQYRKTNVRASTGYGGPVQEALYETIPGEESTPRHSR